MIVEIPTLPSLIDTARREVLAALAESTPPGCFVEVGVYRGGSAAVLVEIAKLRGRAVYLYDTFAGMPCADPELDQHQLGEFADCDLATIRAALPDAHFQVGIFPGTLVDMPPIAFVHADADQYQSTRDICLALGPRMVKGGLMLFDDYRGLKGCIKAVDECFPRREVLPDERALVRF